MRYYPMCRDCVGKVEFSGMGRLPVAEEFKVVLKSPPGIGY